MPLDSDLSVDDTPAGAARPPHLRWSQLALVATGGAIGTAGRESLTLALPSPTGGFPVTILVINVVGAFLLGFLLELLVRKGSSEGRRRTIRLLLGTGVLGGFTTYSAFAVDTARLFQLALPVAFSYAAASLIIGFAASTAGIAAGALLNGDQRRGSAL
ncbi:MAG: fluoride efflux transporter FluC [Microbacteriaceae bacterium]